MILSSRLPQRILFIAPSQYKDQSSREAANYQARVDLAAVYRSLDYFNLGEGVCNHLSLRAPSRVRDEDVMLIIPFGLHWKEVRSPNGVWGDGGGGGRGSEAK